MVLLSGVEPPTLYIETKRFVRLGMSGGNYGSPGRPQWP